MGKSLIITEKPSVAQTYAAVLNVTTRKTGYIENEKYIITWCVGHLVAMSYPEKYDFSLKQWSLESLPFIPEDYKYETIKDVESQYKIVKAQLNRKDVTTILYAGDPAREGIYIQCLVRMMAGHNKQAEEKCVWIDSQTEDEIKRGIKEAKPLSNYLTLADAGYLRAIEDYLIGINFSRVLTIKYGNIVKAATGDEKINIAVGRVMSCVLGMIVTKEREIKNFKETLFYRINCSFGADKGEFTAEWKAAPSSEYYNSPLLYNESGFKRKEDALQFKTKIKKISNVIVENVEKKTEKKYAPLLFNLAELQAECSKKIKISPSETLETVQSLYEKKLTTYPRTDARVLSTAVADVITENIRGLVSHPVYKKYAEEIIASENYKRIADTKYTDDSKISDHYAIIPTGRLENVNNLNEKEKKVYDMIVKRFLSIFYPPAEYRKITVTVLVKNEKFTCSKKQLYSQGYLEIADTQDHKENLQEENISPLSGLKKGEQISVLECNITEGKTSPPNRYTTGSQILAMENAGQLIEDEELRAHIKGSGIGTSATRAEVILKLEKKNYITTDKKTQVIRPGNTGEIIYEILKTTVPDLLVPNMTATWERNLESVVKGRIQRRVYQEHVDKYVMEKVNELKEKDISKEIINSIKKYAVKGFDSETDYGKEIKDNPKYREVTAILGLQEESSEKSADNYIAKWLNIYKFSPEIIKEAYQRTIKQLGEVKLPYINAILSSWHKEHIKTKSDIEKLERRKKKKSPSRKGSSSSVQRKSKNAFNNFEQRPDEWATDYDKLEEELIREPIKRQYKSENPFNNFEQRNTDYDALEEKLSKL